MKKIFLLLTLSALLSLTSKAQDTTKLLIADETTISYTEKTAKIECNSDAVFMRIFKTHDQLFKRFTCVKKHDRYGSYNHYVIFLERNDANIIVKWAKNNL